MLQYAPAVKGMFLQIRNKIENKGFTLVELLVAIAASVIVSTIGMASYLSYSHTQTLNSAALDVVNMLETARGRALTQVKPEGCSGTLEGYTVVLGSTITSPATSSNTVEFAPRCGTNDGEIKSLKLPQDISFSRNNIDIPFKIRFLLLSAGAVKVDNSEQINDIDSSGISVNIMGYSQSKTITIYSNGRIVHN